MRLTAVLCLHVVLGGAACAARSAEPAAPPTVRPGEQTYPDAIRLMCEVDQRAAIAGEVDLLEWAGLRSEYIIDHVKNPDGIEFRTLWSVKDQTEQARCLGAEAKRVGLSSCPLADVRSID